MKFYKHMNIQRIIIDEDGWVWAENDEYKTGLGDIDIDIEIIDKRIKNN